MTSPQENRVLILKALSFKWSLIPSGNEWMLTSPKGETFVAASDGIGMPVLAGAVQAALADGADERTGCFPTQTFTRAAVGSRS